MNTSDISNQMETLEHILTIPSETYNMHHIQGKVESLGRHSRGAADGPEKEDEEDWVGLLETKC